jgi:polyhydroxyalkanoate synthesis regulator phasin
LLGKKLRSLGQDLYVHISTRGSQEFLNDLRSKKDKFYFNLVEHGTLTFEENQELVSKMSLGLQVSYTETMNYYALEHAMHGIPIVTSGAIHFGTTASIDNAKDVAEKAMFLLNNRVIEGKIARNEAEKVVKKNNSIFLEEIKKAMK